MVMRWNKMMKQYKNTNYCVTDDGKVFTYYPTSRKNKYYEKKYQLSNRGYLRISMNIDKKCYMKSIHRLVAESYIPNPNNLPEVNHKDGDKLNNNVSNLEWITKSNNIKHSYDVLKRIRKGAKGEKSGKSKLTNEQVEYVRQHYKPYHKEYSLEALAKKFGVKSNTLHYIIHNKTWV